MLDSYYKPLCLVDLPFQERQDYMHGFDIANPVMKEGFEDYLDPVQRLLEAAGITEGKAFMTVDEKVVQAGQTQRRPFPHVDGQFIPELKRWGHGGGGGWNHYCNHLPIARMPVIVAASVEGCKAWLGEFEAEPKNNGDLSHISDTLGMGEVLKANIGYLLSPDCIHESLPMEHTVPRSFLRIALPVDFTV